MLNVAFILDENYYLPTYVAIISLLENKKKTSEYVINLIYTKLNDSQKKELSNLEKKYDNCIIKLHYFSQHELNEKYSSIKEHHCTATNAALLKFELPQICKDIDRLLYLDGDIIIKDDLCDLVNIEFEDNKCIAVVPESGMLYSKNLIQHGISDYFNSGVILFDLEKMRQNNITELLVEAKKRNQDTTLMDQNIFNFVMKDMKILLPHRYNVLIQNIMRARYFYGITLEDINGKFNTSYKKWDEIKEKATIVHYSSFDKPWKYLDVYAVELWDKYYSVAMGDTVLKRKKTHEAKINKLRQHKCTALLGTFIWECEVKGVKEALRDIVKFVKKGK